MPENFCLPKLKPDAEGRNEPAKPNLYIGRLLKEIKFFLEPENQHILKATASAVNKNDPDWANLSKDIVKLRDGTNFLINVLSAAIKTTMKLNEQEADEAKNIITRQIEYIKKKFFWDFFHLDLIGRRHPDAAGHDFSKAEQSGLFPDLLSPKKARTKPVGKKIKDPARRDGPRVIESPHYADKNFKTFLELSHPDNDRSDGRS